MRIKSGNSSADTPKRQHSPSETPTTPTLPISQNMFSWDTIRYHTGVDGTLIVLWVDDDPNKFEHKYLIGLARKRGINVCQKTTTKEALEWLESLKKVFQSRMMIKLRIITDMFRVEYGVKKETAGMELIKSVSEMVWLQEKLEFIKIYDGKCDTQEVMVYLFFNPIHLSTDNLVFKEIGKEAKNASQKKIYYVDYDMTLTDPFKSLNQFNNYYGLLFQRSYIKKILDALKYDLETKLKREQSFRYEIVNVRHYFNLDLLIKHRDLYFEYSLETEELFHKGQTETYHMPKSLIVYHGTPEKAIESIIENGFDPQKITSANGAPFFGHGFYVTTYPQYAMNYMKAEKYEISQSGIQSPVSVGETVKILSGFAIPGKMISKNDFDFGKDTNPNCDSHVVRVTHRKYDNQVKGFSDGDFVPIQVEKKPKGQETADEIVLLKPEQFLPSFVITFKRTQ